MSNCLLLFILISAIPLVNARNNTRIAIGNTCSDRVAILLAGIDSRYKAGDSENQVEDTFSDIIADVLPDIDYKRVIYYSYRPSSPTEYNEQDTFEALPNKGIQALHEMIQHEINNCRDVQIDLIGHSLGGAVAFYYMRYYGLGSDTEEARHVKHVVTLDSPVNGSSRGLLAYVWYRGKPVILYLIALTNENTKKLNISFAKQISPYTVIRTLASRQDQVVPEDDAIIKGFEVSLSLGVNLLRCRIPDHFLWGDNGVSLHDFCKKI